MPKKSLQPLNSRNDLVAISAKLIQSSSAYKLCEMYALFLDGEVLVSDEAMNIIYNPDNLLPVIVMLDQGRKVYKLDWPPKSGQDASDIPLFQEILLMAMRDEDRDAETCKTIVHIQQHLVSPILARLIITQREMSAEDIADPEKNYGLRELRRLVLAAEFQACTIWREGRLRKAR
jgi:hypothetical protein